MKKLFAMFLVILVVLSGCHAARTADTTIVTHSTESTPTVTAATAVEIPTAMAITPDDGTLTIATSESYSWKVLQANVPNITSTEDMYVQWLVNALTKPLTAPIYNNLKFINYSMGGIRVSEVDTERLTQKFQSVLDVYNATHELQVELVDAKILGSAMQIDVQSTNVADLENPVLTIGSLAIVKENSTYWETSYQFGRGRSNTVTPENIYVPVDRIVTVNAVSYLTEDGNIQSSFYRTFEQLQEQNPNISIEICKRRMLHICTQYTDLGWVSAEHLTSLEKSFEVPKTTEDDTPTEVLEEGKPVAPEDFAKVIENAESGKTVVLLDISSSIDEYGFVSKTVQFWKEINFSQKKILTFNSSISEITKNDVNYLRFSGKTDLYGALNKAIADAEITTVILISDLEDTIGHSLIESDKKISLSIYCPKEDYRTDSIDILRNNWKNADITISIFQ